MCVAIEIVVSDVSMRRGDCRAHWRVGHVVSAGNVYGARTGRRLDFKGWLVNGVQPNS